MTQSIPRSLLFDTSIGQVSALEWGEQDASQIIVALHGWLDNAATFTLLGPMLAHQDTKIIALDLPGHGESAWLPDGGDYYIWEACTTIVEVLRCLDGEAHLLGHSMGAATSFIVAATYPELVASVVALDAIGPLSTPANQAPAQLKKGIEDVLRRSQKGYRLKYYKNEGQALTARVGNDPLLTPACIRPVVERNLKHTAKGYHWRTDPRLRHASKVRMTEDMVAAFFQRIKAPVLVVKAESGLIPQTMFEMRLAYISDVRFVVTAGHHHFHLDPATVADVAGVAARFYQE